MTKKSKYNWELLFKKRRKSRDPEKMLVALKMADRRQEMKELENVDYDD